LISEDEKNVERAFLLLASLNEAIDRLVSHAEPETFWEQVCKSSRWLVPARRICVVLRDEGGSLREVARMVQGSLVAAKEGPLRSQSDPLGKIMERARGARPGVLPAAEAAPGERDDLREWLFADQPALLVHAPMRHESRTLGHMLWAAGPLSESDRRAVLAGATSYALQAGVLYVKLNAYYELRAARAELEQKNAELLLTQGELSEKLDLIQAQNQKLLAMSAPVIKVGPGILTLPVVGVIDTPRVQQMTEALLRAVMEERARRVMIDLTGMSLADMDAIGSLIKLAEAVKLLGSACALTGVSPALAQRLADHGVPSGAFSVFATLDRALAHAMARGARSP
jgi:anti-anti-sigma regulatory factor